MKYSSSFSSDFFLFGSDVFSLPIPALWTVVLGDHNRMIHERSEQRIPVDRIFIHDHFHNYHNDIGKAGPSLSYYLTAPSIAVYNRYYQPWRCKKPPLMNCWRDFK